MPEPGRAALFTVAVALLGLAGCLGGGDTAEPGASATPRGGDTAEPAASATPRGEIFFYAPVWGARLNRVELPDGPVTTQRISPGAGDVPFRVVLTGGRLVYWGPRAPYAVDTGFRTPPRRLGRGRYSYFVPSRRPGHVWLAEQDRSDERRPTLSGVQEVPVNGGPAGTSRRLPPGRWTTLVGSVGPLLLLGGESRGIAAWDPRVRAVVDWLPTRRIVATHARLVAWRARRELVISRLTGGALEVERRVRGGRLPAGSGEFSPDGSRLALPGEKRLVIVTTRTGAARSLDDADVRVEDEIAWSEDGAWIYLADRLTGEIRAYEPAADRATPVGARAPVYGGLAFMDMAAR